MVLFFRSITLVLSITFSPAVRYIFFSVFGNRSHQKKDAAAIRAIQHLLYFKSHYSPIAIRLAIKRNAPGTPSGNSLKKLNPV